MLADMHVFQTGPTPLFCDNQGVLKLAKNPVIHERTKHVETHCHYICQLVEDGSVQLRYVPTTEQPADIFTKPLGPYKFVKIKGSIGVVNRLSIKGGYQNMSIQYLMLSLLAVANFILLAVSQMKLFVHRNLMFLLL